MLMPGGLPERLNRRLRGTMSDKEQGPTTTMEIATNSQCGRCEAHIGGWALNQLPSPLPAAIMLAKISLAALGFRIESFDFWL